MQNQGRQGEIIDRMGLFAAPEIGQVLGVGHIGFGEQDHRFCGVIGQKPHQFHDGMGLRQVDAIGADLFPQKRHRIEPDDAHPLVDMQPHDPQKFEQNLGVGEIQIDLIMAEGAPDMARPIGGFDLAQQGLRAGAHHLAQIVVGTGFKEKPVIGRMALQIGVEPDRLRGHMIEHQIGHQQKLRPDARDVLPIAQNGIHGAIIRHRKSVVGGIGKKRQDMHAVDHPREMLVQKVAQQIQWLMRAIHDGIAIGDDHRIGLGPLLVSGGAAAFAAVAFFGPKGLDHLRGEDIAVQMRVNLPDQLPKPRAKARCLLCLRAHRYDPRLSYPLDFKSHSEVQGGVCLAVPCLRSKLRHC